MSGQTPHHSEQRSTPSTRSCALYRGSITVRGAGPKLVAKIRRQLRKNRAKGCVASSTELATRGLLTPSEARSALLVCCRFIRYQSNLLLVSRGFSVISGMSRKCPLEMMTGIDRILDVYTPTRDILILTWVRLNVKSRRKPPSLSNVRRLQRALARCTLGPSP